MSYDLSKKAVQEILRHIRSQYQDLAHMGDQEILAKFYEWEQGSQNWSFEEFCS